MKTTVDSLYLDYPLRRTSLYLELLSWSFEHFHQIHLNFSLSISSLFISKKISVPLQLFSLYLELLLACYVIQVSYRLSYGNTGSVLFKHPGDTECEIQNLKQPRYLELCLRMWISQYNPNLTRIVQNFFCEWTAFKELCFDSISIEKNVCFESKANK